MGKLEVQINQSGAWTVVTSSGARFRLADREGHLGITALEGVLAIHPVSGNAVNMEARDWTELAPPRSALEEAWAEGCRKGLATNPGWDEQALGANPYGDGHG